MRYRELHLGNQRAFIIPAARAKNNLEFELHLSDEALAVIKAIPHMVSDAGYVFTTNGKTPFTGYSKAKKKLDQTMLEIAKAEDPALTAIPNWTLHDLRRTGTTRVQRLGFEKEIADACINHVAADNYTQHDYGPEKVKAFQSWGREVMRLVMVNKKFPAEDLPSCNLLEYVHLTGDGR